MAFDLNMAISAVGAVAGIGGAVVSYQSYRASVALKKHDFQLQLKIANENLRARVAEIPELIERAAQSRSAIDASTGMARSGAHQLWEAQVARYRQELEELQRELPAKAVHEDLSLKHLVSLIATTHSAQMRADRLHEALLAALAEDDMRRQALAADRRAAMAAQLARPLKKTLGE